ncbi:glycosyltransferase [Singulisphaera rosea]
MAALAHGKPVVSNPGRYSETIWADEGCVALAPNPDPGALAGLVGSLIERPEPRAKLGEAALATYRRHFAIERTVETVLRDVAPSAAPMATLLQARSVSE